MALANPDPGFAGPPPPQNFINKLRQRVPGRPIDPGFSGVPPMQRPPQRSPGYPLRGLNAQGAMQNVARAMQQQQGQPGGYIGAPHPLQQGGGQNLAMPGQPSGMMAYNAAPEPGGGSLGAPQMRTPRGMPQDVSGPQQQMIFKNTANGPIYYGTPEASQLTFEGLRRVKSGYGQNSPQFRRALNAAMGVLGPQWDVGAITSAISGPQGN